MVDYFTSSEVKRIGQPQNNLVSVLQKDCKRLDSFTLKSLKGFSDVFRPALKIKKKEELIFILEFIFLLFLIFFLSYILFQ